MSEYIITNTTDPSQSSIITNANLGVGNTNPSEKLSILGGGIRVDVSNRPYNEGISIVANNNVNYGVVNFHKVATAGDAYSSNTIKWTAGYGYTPEGGGGGSDFSFAESNSNTRLIIKSGGNVGIGTTAPTNNLHIKAAANSDAKIMAEGQTANYYASLELKTPDHHYSICTTRDVVGNFSVYDVTNLAHRLTITSDGNIGIGTSSPGVNGLEVHKSSGNAVIGISSPSTNIQALSWCASDTGLQADLVFHGNQGTYGKLILDFDIVGDVLCIDSTGGGRIGLGTNNPGELVEIAKSAADVTLQLHETYYDKKYTIGIDFSDNDSLKIGTTNIDTNTVVTIKPTDIKISCNLNVNPSNAIGTNVNGAACSFYAQSGSTGTANGGNLLLHGGTPGSTGGLYGNVLISALGGSVGIGTATSPNSKLQVTGGDIEIGDTGKRLILNVNNTALGTQTDADGRKGLRVIRTTGAAPANSIKFGTSNMYLVWENA
jgi:hypothetical protein